MPSKETLIYGDSGWYDSISKNGYVHEEGRGSNTAFFILFPLLWKISTVNALGMSILNLLIFSTGFSILAGIRKVSVQMKLIFLSIPSVFFMFVPYTEALFFLLMSVCFYGIVKKKSSYIFISLFLVALTRSTTTVLAPAFLMMKLLLNEEASYTKTLKNYFVIYLLPMLLGFVLFCFYEYVQTGLWLDYFYQQSEFWGHKFSWPVLLFNSNSGFWVLIINAFALFTAIIGTFYLAKIFYQKIFRKIPVADPLFLVSLLYMLALAVIVVFYSPTWITGTTNINGAHRYIMATPFFFIFLSYFDKRKYSLWSFLLLVVAVNLFSLFFNVTANYRFFAFFNIGTAMIGLYTLIPRKNMPTIIIVLVNMVIQVYFFQMFMAGSLPD